MHAATIRPERYGPPIGAFDLEEIEVPPVGPRQVLVNVMAAGINYNGVWTALAKPVDMIAMRRKRGETLDFHVGGSEGSGIVWAVGEKVRSVKVGDHVALSSCRWDVHAQDVRMGADPITSSSASVWGYEDNYGSFAQFTTVEEYQCFPKPAHLTWEQASCYMVGGCTAYRQLMGWPPNVVRPGDPVLVWGAAGGLGSFAIQLTRIYGGVPIAVVSDESKFEHCRKLGAKSIINRNDFDHWGRLPDLEDDEAFGRWLQGARAFGRKIWDVLGERRNPTIVFEHSGQDTIPTSLYVCDNSGMVVICGGTSGYNADVDLRFLWMRQKRLQGSHFATTAHCAAFNQLVCDGRVDPCMSRVFPFNEIGKAHQMMYENQHPPGNMALLVNAPGPGLTDMPARGAARPPRAPAGFDELEIGRRHVLRGASLAEAEAPGPVRHAFAAGARPDAPLHSDRTEVAHAPVVTRDDESLGGAPPGRRRVGDAAAAGAGSGAPPGSACGSLGGGVELEAAVSGRERETTKDWERLEILGVQVTDLLLSEAIGLIESLMQKDDGRTRSIYFVNANTFNLACSDPVYREVLGGADYVFGDGTGVRWAARLLHGVRLRDNVNGTDLLPALLSGLRSRGYRYYLLGASPEALPRAAAHVREVFPGWSLVGAHHGHGSPERDRFVVEEINDAKPHLLLVGMGNPRQERWIHSNRQRLRVPVCMAVGGLFDYWAGDLRRAPRWLRRLGFEWVHLMRSQPRKVPRYLLGNPLFLYRVIRSR
jgi:crotonyl-CoA carboxylase/reductase